MAIARRENKMKDFVLLLMKDFTRFLCFAKKKKKKIAREAKDREET